MKYILLLVKGFFIGIANIIPGVSGGTIAIILGIYEQLISTISHFFSNLKENLLFVIPIGIGLLVSIGVMSGVIEYSYDNFPVPTMMFFVGLVLGGIPMLMKNVINKKESKSPINFVIFLSPIGLSEFCDMNLLFVKNFLYQKDSCSKRCTVKPIMIEDNNEITGNPDLKELF